MANNIGWGQAHKNNSIGYGQGGVNNTIDWAKMYKRSNSGETVLSPEGPTYFGIVVDTSIQGTGTVTADNQFQFTGALGDYDVTALQNDVEVATFNDLSGEQTITLPSAGVYELRVEPKEVNGFNRIAFNNSGDRNKLLEILSWGSNVVWGNMTNSFRGCENLGECNITDTPDLTQCTSINNMFLSATSFNSDLSNWDVSNVTDFRSMFLSATSFNSDLSNWDVSSATSFERMFQSATSFNSDLSNWDVSNVTNFRIMFFNATSFKSDLSQWNVSNGINFVLMFSGIDINEPNTTTNYDNLLNGWSQLSLNNNLSFDGGNSQYSSAGEVGRNILINTYNWTISDGGLKV